LRRIAATLATAALPLALAAPAQAAYCGENDVVVVHAGRNTSCALALNAANKAISYDNAYGIWPMHIHAYSRVKHRFYGLDNVAYFSDYLKWRGHGRDSTISFSLSGEDLI
jgi:hypothetical protein